MDDRRYELLVEELRDADSLPFEERVLLSTSRDVLAVAIVEFAGCRGAELACLSRHLLDAEVMAHSISGANQDDMRAACIRGARVLPDAVASSRYHYDVYRRLLAWYGGERVTCSDRLLAVRDMYFGGDHG